MIATARVLFVVHPGSCCGSATFSLGDSLARDMRESLVSELDRWTGDVLVMDGWLSDELPGFPGLHRALNDALARAPRALRTFACDSQGEHFRTRLPKFIEQSPWRRPSSVHFAITGAWFDPADRSGCVNATRDVLRAHGFDSEVLDSAFTVLIE